MKRAHSPAEAEVESNEKKLKLSPASDDNSAFITRLTRLLDLTTLSNLTTTTLADRFSQISQALISQSHLVVRDASGKESRFKILELEFYLRIPEVHEDPFIHGSQEQRVLGQWYFHRAPSKAGNGGYKGGTRKGLDLTFGRPAHSSSSFGDIRGGIILRSIEDVTTGTLTTGPCLLVEKILSLSTSTGLKELVEEKWNGDISAFKSSDSEDRCRLYLDTVPSSGQPSKPIYHSPRIGLDLAAIKDSSSSELRNHPRVQYLIKPYRHFTFPKKTDQQLKGKSQNFIGVFYESHHHLDISLPLSNTSQRDKVIRRIREAMGGTPAQTGSNLQHYLDGYATGQKGNGLSQYVGSKGKGLNGAKLLEMFGVLDGFLGEDVLGKVHVESVDSDP